MSKPSLLPPAVATAFASVAARFAALSRPARVLIATSTALTLLFGAVVFYREAHEPYAVLFSQLEQDDAAAIVAKLKELKQPYRLEAGNTTVEVPASKVAELRMDLVGSGLPRGGGVGFESFDKMRLGATEFEQRVLYRRSLEGELARTVGSLAAVQSARVHLVLPEKSVFVSKAEPASASIMLRLRSGRSLGPSEVHGIVSLTAAAVPGLTADRVAVVTTDGLMLKKPRPGASDGVSASDDEVGGEQRALETQLEDRARSMLEKVVGPGHVDVRVTAELDPARVEHVEDHYDPARTALRSEELTRERSGLGLDDTVAGVPGAESNLPSGSTPGGNAPVAATSSGSGSGGQRAASAAAARGGDQPFRESHTRNFEVDHVSDKRFTKAGALRRVGVAVILDGVARVQDGKRVWVPRERVELDRFASLVRSAVGASDARGDSVTVESVPFEDSGPPETVAAAAPPATRGLRAYAPAAAAALVLVLLATGVALKRRRRDPALAGSVVATALAGTVDVPRIEATASPADLRARALERAAQDPATAALVLRFWLGTTETNAKS